MSRQLHFVCGGVQKGGTTSFYAYCAAHPAFSPPVRKELHFFDDETQDWAAPNYDRLHRSFAADDGNRLRFEVTPIYLFWPPSIARLRAYRSDLRLVFLFRDPYERALSNWAMEVHRAGDTMSFADAIRHGRERLSCSPPLADERRVLSYLERGLYGAQLRNLFAHFPREQTLLLRSEDLDHAPAQTLRRVARFLDVPDFPVSSGVRMNRRAAGFESGAGSPADLRLVADFVRDDLSDFAALSGLDVSQWPCARV